MLKRFTRIDAWPKQVVILVCIWFVTLVGLIDYATGYETFFFTYYLLPIFAATWRVNTAYGILMSALSVTAWVSANAVAGAHYSTYFVPVWNAGIMFAIYVIIVMLLARIKKMNAELEERVRLRTEALTREIQERMRLQRELLESTDREQRRIGRELHDGLCQHLTGTALAGHLLGQKLSNGSSMEASEASRLVQLVEEAIEMTRTLSHQLDPVELKSGKLADHLEDLAASTSQQFKLNCQFECGLTEPIDDPAVATHLYRIAQEAVLVASRHRRASWIDIELQANAGSILLTIVDDGTAEVEKNARDAAAGAQAMAYRADLIGAVLKVEHIPAKGTRVACELTLNETKNGRENQNITGR